MMSELNRDSYETSTGQEQAYLNELLLALRMRGVPGPRIAEAVAEVSAHLSETGETPQEAFGPAQAYAGEVAAALGDRDAHTPFWRAALSWISAVYGVGGALGAWLVIDGARASATAERGVGGLPAMVCLAMGLAILLALGVGLVRLTRKRDDQILDPRSGANMAPPLPRWVVPLMLTVPILVLVIAVVISLTARPG
jgi:hypothetical protein